MKYTMIDRLFAMTFGKILNIHKTNETQTMIFLPIMPTYKYISIDVKKRKKGNRFEIEYKINTL